MPTRRVLAWTVGIGLVASAAATAAAEPPSTAPRLWLKAEGGADADAGMTAGRSPAPALEHRSYESGKLFTQSLAAVLVILALGGAAIFVVKRLLPRLGITQGRRVSVLETVYLGPRKSLHLVQAGDRSLLVGDTRERLSLLADLTGSVDAEESPPPPPVPHRRKPKFHLPIRPEGGPETLP